jgi:hypothetical protein
MVVKLVGPGQDKAPRHVSGGTAPCILGLQRTVNVQFQTCGKQPPVHTGVGPTASLHDVEKQLM